MALTEYSSASGSRRGLAALAGRDAYRTVVLLRGEYDASTVTSLSEAMARAIALDDADLVLDLRGVEFMDAATVRLIIRAREFLRLRSRSLTLRSPSTHARRVLDLCGLDDHLDRDPVDAARMTRGVGTLASRRRRRRLDVGAVRVPSNWLNKEEEPMRRSKPAALVTVMLLVAASCGDDDDDDGGTGTGTGTGLVPALPLELELEPEPLVLVVVVRRRVRWPPVVRLTSGCRTTPRRRRGVRRWWTPGTPTTPTSRSPSQEIPAGETSEAVIAASITAGNAPCLIFNTAPAAVPQFQKAGGLVALDGFEDSAAYVTERSGERAEQYRSPDGNLYQMPWKANPVMIFYNKEMFTAAGLDPENPPLSTYDEFLATSRTLVSDGGAQAAIWPAPTSQFFQNWFDFYPMYIAASGKQLVEDGEATFATEEGFGVADFWRTMYDEELAPREEHTGDCLRRRPGGDVDRRTVGDRRVRRRRRLGRRSRTDRRGHAAGGDPNVQRREVDRHVHRL